MIDVIPYIALLISILTLGGGFIATTRAAKSTYVDELAKELELVRRRLLECERNCALCDVRVADLISENISLMRRIFDSDYKKDSAIAGQAYEQGRRAGAEKERENPLVPADGKKDGT